MCTISTSFHDVRITTGWDNEKLKLESDFVDFWGTNVFCSKIFTLDYNNSCEYTEVQIIQAIVVFCTFMCEI